jgi:hypothetical protein
MKTLVLLVLFLLFITFTSGAQLTPEGRQQVPLKTSTDLEMERKLKEVREEIDDLRNTHEALKRDVETLQSKVATLNSLVEIHRRVLVTLQEEYKERHPASNQK